MLGLRRLRQDVRLFYRPYRTSSFSAFVDPAINRWAIFIESLRDQNLLAPRQDVPGFALRLLERSAPLPTDPPQAEHGGGPYETGFWDKA